MMSAKLGKDPFPSMNRPKETYPKLSKIRKNNQNSFI